MMEVRIGLQFIMKNFDYVQALGIEMKANISTLALFSTSSLTEQTVGNVRSEWIDQRGGDVDQDGRIVLTVKLSKEMIMRQEV